MNEMSVQLAAYVVSERIPCPLAFRAAQDLGQSPKAIGEAADRSGLRISRCQLGLFGFEGFGEKRVSGCVKQIAQELRATLASRAPSGDISCAQAWRVADELGIPRLLVGAAANEMDIRIIHCQLGCFD